MVEVLSNTSLMIPPVCGVVLSPATSGLSVATQLKVTPVERLVMLSANGIFNTFSQTVTASSTPTGSGLTVTVAVKSSPTHPPFVGVMV